MNFSQLKFILFNFNWKICRKGLLRKGKCLSNFKCENSDACASCEYQTFPRKYEACTSCLQGLVGDLRMAFKVPILVCEDPAGNEDLVGCLSAEDGSCLICRKGFYMDDESLCIKI